MHSKNDINNYAWWETDGGDKVLNFAPFGKAKEIARIYQDKNGDWWGDLMITSEYVIYLDGKVVGESDVMKIICEKIIDHWEEERDYYNDMLEKFTSQEGTE